jgi:tetratricopeptide (TPR) repeat protein
MAVAALAAGALATAARAEEPARPDSAAARARFDRGQTLYNLGKLDAAIVELEAAYQLDPDPAYLFNLAQAHRLAGHRARALFFYRRYLALAPAAPNRAEVSDRITALEAEDRVLRAEREALARAAAAAARAELAAAHERRRHRLGIEVGWSQLYLDGLAQPPPQLIQGARYALRLRRFGRSTLELGASYHETTIPYVNPRTGAVAAAYSQLVAGVTYTHHLGWRLGARAGLGLGVSTARNLEQGNPLSADGLGTDPQGFGCARAELGLALALHPLFEATLTLAAVSFAPRNAEVTPALESVSSFETLHLGLSVRL